MGRTYAHYRPARTPLQRARFRWRQWRNERTRHRSDGRSYIGWTARVTAPLDEVDDVPRVGSEGLIVAAEMKCGDLAHEIRFPDVVMTLPLPVPEIELTPPPDLA